MIKMRIILFELPLKKTFNKTKALLVACTPFCFTIPVTTFAASTLYDFERASIISPNFIGSDLYIPKFPNFDSDPVTKKAVTKKPSALKKAPPKKERFLSELSFRSNELIDDIGEEVGNRFFVDFGVDLNGRDASSKKEERLKGLDYKFSFRSRLNDQEQLMVSVPEAYISYSLANIDFNIGRKILDWSELDLAWGFGKLNNRVNFDYFTPGQEGLTGVLTNFSLGRYLKIDFFLSSIYVPELNPGQKYDEDEGSVTCQNMWCKPLFKTANLGEDGQNKVPIFYNVNMPDNNDVVFRYSVGGRVKLDFKKLQLEGFFLRKPENQVSISAEIQYQTSLNRVYVDATPKFYYHDVKGATIRYIHNENIMVYASGLSVIPNNYPDGNIEFIEYTGIKPEKRNEDYLGGGAVYAGESIKANINYVARVSDYDIDVESPLAEYPRWNQALNINLNYLIREDLMFVFDYKFDMLPEGGFMDDEGRLKTVDRLTVVNLTYVYNKDIVLSAGLNAIGTDEDRESFWSDFSNNDSVYISGKYVF